MKTITLIFSIFIISMVPLSLMAQIQSQSVSRHLSASHPLLPPLIATEEEIRQFFATYIDRYTQKDLDGFLSLFSSKAVQNQKDGIERIKKIYGDFFNKSKELRYQIEEMRIEIYQNGVEVEARYELGQMPMKGGEQRAWRGQIRWRLVRESEALKILSIDYQQ
jgi:ketosteroid isomerase-like protein